VLCQAARWPRQCLLDVQKSKKNYFFALLSFPLPFLFFFKASKRELGLGLGLDCTAAFFAGVSKFFWLGVPQMGGAFFFVGALKSQPGCEALH